LLSRGSFNPADCQTSVETVAQTSCLSLRTYWGRVTFSRALDVNTSDGHRGTAVPTYLPLVVWSRALEGLGRVPLAQIFVALGASVSFALMAILIHFEIPIYALLFALVVCGPVIAHLSARRSVMMQLQDWTRQTEASKYTRLPDPNLDFLALVIAISSALSWSIDAIVVQVAIGSEAAGQVAIASRITQVFLMLLTGMFPVLWLDNHRDIDRPSTDATVALLACAAGAGCFLAIPIASRWIGLDSNVLMASGCTAFILLTGLQLTAAARQTDPSGLRFQAKTLSFMAAVNLPASYFLCGPLGSAGPIIASCVTYLFIHILPLFRREKVLRRA